MTTGRSQRVAAGVLGIAMFALAAIGFVRLLGSERTPAGEPIPSPEPTLSGGMWPQTSLDEVRRAQELADAGDPEYTWQVDPELKVVGREGPYEAEIFARFLREELGWEEFGSLAGFNFGQGSYSKVEFFRCAPGPDECAPTVDGLRYETVSIDVAQLGRPGPSGIWVVTRWEVTSPVEPMSPSEAETAHVEAFLQARIDGEGAEEYLLPGAEVPLLYTTTTGAPFERSEFELVGGPERPYLASMMFKVRLFAENDETVVEQFVRLERNEAGRLALLYSTETLGPSGMVLRTTENGQEVPSGTAS